MTGKTHQLIGTTLSAAALLAMGVPPLSAGFGAGLLVGVLASVLPDVDADPAFGDPAAHRLLGLGRAQRRRRLRRSLERARRARSPLDLLLGLGGAAGELLLAVPALLLSAPRLAGHRGFTHWGVTWLFLSALVLAAARRLESWAGAPAGASLALLLALPFAAGYGSHLLADMATHSGIPLLGPFSGRRCHLLPRRLRLRTGSREERLFCLLWTAAAAPILLYLVLR